MHGGSNDIFVRKYDSSGNEVWTDQFGGTGNQNGKGIAVDGSGDVYVSAENSASPGGLVRKYDSNGNMLWEITIAGGSVDGIAVDSFGDVTVSGGTGGGDVIIRKYDADGNILVTRQLGSPADDYALGTAADGIGNVYVGGYTRGSLPGSTFLGGFADAFIVQLAPTFSSVGNVSVDFNSVDQYHTQPYFSYVTATGKSPKTGFKFVPQATYYDITPASDLQYTTPAEVCISWNEGDLTDLEEAAVELSHWVDGTGWVSITTSLDVVSNKVCGLTDSFSDFAVMVPLPATPVVGSISAPLDPQVVGTEIFATAIIASSDFSDQDYTAVWSWGDTSTSAGTVSEKVVSGSHTYTTPGVYEVDLSVTVGDSLPGEASFFYVVVYDPAGGFVTGGGWIDSPAGAYAADESLFGKANFGFNSKYQNGASVPSGQTQFSFKVGNLNFHSTSYEWLVVAGSQAKFKGVGTINGTGNYGFMLTAKDGSPDTFRIKIWDRDNGDAVVYDNQMGDSDGSYDGTNLGGGSIVVHH